MKQVNYHFYNPNSKEASADFLLKLFVEVNAGKVEAAVQKAAAGSAGERYIQDDVHQTYCDFPHPAK